MQNTLNDLLESQAVQRADHLAYTFLADGETETQRLTYGVLAQRVRALAAVLGEQAANGDRVLLCHPPGLDYIVAFFGCLAAGLVAVPAYPLEPHRSSRAVPRLQAMVENAQARLALTTQTLLPTMRDLFAQHDPGVLTWLASDSCPDNAGQDWSRPAVDPASLAFLMYTSGSTGTPKGVMVSHEQVMSNLSSFQGFVARPASTFVSWLPFFHDLGLLFGVLHPLYRGVPSVLMPPLAFVQRPLRWLRTISHYRASTTGAPNFAYDLCVRKVSPEQRASLDLTSWNMALNGAEPVRPETLDRFVAAFGPCGFRREVFYPSYGLADATATVSGGADFAPPTVLAVQRRALEQRHVIEVAGEPDGARTLVGCGPCLPAHTVRIVDPETRRPCAADQVGEIWVLGPSIGAGYWKRPAETALTFGAYLDETGEGPFLRTGDLGFLRDEEIFLTGRLKDLIIIHGRNHAPEDIEQTVERSHPALRAGGGAAFSVDAAGEERLVIIQEVQAIPATDTKDMIAAVQRAVVEYHDIVLYAIILIKPGSAFKTSSGKNQRYLARQAFLEGQLECVAEWRQEVSDTADDGDGSQPGAGVLAAGSQERQQAVEGISDWLITYFAQRLHIDPREIDVRQPFSSYGLASAEAVSLVADLEVWLGRSLAPTLAWEYPTITALARHLSGDQALIEAYAQTAAPLDQAAEPIAIVGIGCRFPGAGSPAAFWELLAAGRDAIADVPPERWDSDELYDPDMAAPGKMTTRWGGFLERLEQFDPHFFGISPREAPHLDPRQRLMLEATWEALEDAGVPPDRLAGSAAGVFVAVLTNDYDQMLFSDLSRVDAYSGSGTANSIIANRLSYFFDLHGPSVALDTACSGSLVAIHLACQSLRSGESTLALAAGVGVNLLPKGNIFFSKAGALSPDGRCKTFDERANGIVRSDGCGVLVLKPLARAIADNDPIYAVIRGSAVNSDGRSNGIMAPNRYAQEAVLREAYRQAGIAPSRVQYIEAHGTGTSLGDPIEMQALASVLGAERQPDQICVVGSLKTNMGHMEPAAGVAGVIKVALAIKHRALPPNLHFQQANPLIPFDQIPFAVQRQLGRWPREHEPLIAGVSGFGFGGTNAHVVLHEAPVAAVAAPEPPPGGHSYLFVLSARAPQALRASAEAHRQLLASGDAVPALHDLCYTAGVRRMHHEHRLTLMARSHDELAEQLRAFLQGEPLANAAVGQHIPGQQPRIVFVFSGQGSHWLGMGCELLRQEPVFRATIAQCERLLRQYVPWSLQEELRAGASASRLNETDVAQPAIFAVQVALAALWRSWGVQPSVVVGQSLGEAAAAHVAGALSLEDAVRVVVHRSRLMKSTAGKGRTALVGLTLEQAQLALTGHEDLLAVAGSNSPISSVLSGDPDRLDRVLTSLERRGIFCRRLNGVDIAFHSPQMDPLQDELMRSLEGITPRATTVPLFSTVTAASIAGEQLDASYWSRNLREPFRFATVVQQLIDEGYATFLEISPHPVLNHAIQEGLHAAERDGMVLSSLRREAEERPTLLASLGSIFAIGASLDLARLYPDGGRCVALPTYPWQRERYWLDQLGGKRGAGLRAGRSDRAAHPLLGSPLSIALIRGQSIWESELDSSTPSYLADHRVGGAVVLPGAAYLEMGLAAGSRALGGVSLALERVGFKQALFLPDEDVRRVQFGLVPAESGSATFQIFSARIAESGEAPAWMLHATGTVSRTAAPQAPACLALGQIQSRCVERIPGAAHYQAMQARGLTYGPAFQAIGDIWRRDGEALGLLQLPERGAQEAARYLVHPALLDAGFQTVAAALPSSTLASRDTYLPVALDRLQLYGPLGTRVWCHVTLQSSGDAQADVHEADLAFTDESGQVLAEVRRLCLQRIGGTQQATPDLVDDWLYAIEWQPAPRPAIAIETSRPEPGSWLIFMDSQGVGAALADHLAAQRERCLFVQPGAEYRRDGDEYQLDQARPEDMRVLLDDVRAAGLPPLRGLVYLWGLDAPSLDDAPTAALEAVQPLVGTAVVALVQALAAANAQQQAPRLWLVTRVAMPVASQPSRLAVLQAALWGLGRVIALEHPELWGGLVDLAADAPPDEPAQLFEEVWNPDGENQVGFRGAARYVARLAHARAERATARPFQLRRDASYVITGGLGGLGLRVARWLAEQGARRLVLVGRTALPHRSTWSQIDTESALGRQITAIQQLEALGCSVYPVAVDIADERQLAAFLETYRQEAWPPIRGVVHAAGIIQDRLLLGMDPAAFSAVLRPKILGAWLLHRALETEPLDFFVLFSSIAAVLGQFGQANYAAGNAVMDALAHDRRAQGLPAMSINWGAWSEVGMAAELSRSEHFVRMGVTPIAPEQGVEALALLLEREPAQCVVVPANWQQMRHALPAAPLLALLGQDEAAAHAAPTQALPSLGQELRALNDPAERQARVEAYLQELAAHVLQLDPAQLNRQQPLNVFGLDSIMAVKLTNRIRDDLGITLSVADVLMGAGVLQLATQIVPQLAGGNAVGDLLAEIDQLSFEDVATLLATLSD